MNILRNLLNSLHVTGTDIKFSNDVGESGVQTDFLGYSYDIFNTWVSWLVVDFQGGGAVSLSISRVTPCKIEYYLLMV